MIEVNKIAIPFAKSGNKSVIYDTRQQGQPENEATWSTGFPPVTMIRKEDGGLPPTGLDFNGIFYDISSNIVFACMGGRYKFDAEYAEKIGGYPKGAILLNDKENMQYISNTDNNKTNFNTADASKLTDWSIISIADIDKLLAKKIDNADFSEALNKKANTSTNINAGNGLTGGGDLTTSRTLTLGTPSTISQNTKNSVTTSSHTHEIAKATTAQAGIAQLTSTLSDREDLSATPKIVNDVNRDVVTAQKTANTANDKANAAQTRADSAYSLAQTKQDKETAAKINNAGVLNIKSEDRLGRVAQFINVGGVELDARVTNAGLYVLRIIKDDNESVINFQFLSGTNTVYSTGNTTTDKSGFLRTKGTVNALVESDVTNSLGNSKSLVASQALVNSLAQKIDDVPVDKIFVFDSATPPKGYIARNGQAIDKNTMPKLYARYGANMPDDRDRVHRMSGALAGTAGSTQEDSIQRITGDFSGRASNNVPQSTVSSIFAHATGVFEINTFTSTSKLETLNQTAGIDSLQRSSIKMDTSLQARTSTETRVKSRIVIFCNKIQ